MTGFVDPKYTSSTDEERESAFDLSASVDAGLARIDVRWANHVTAGEPADATNSTDPAYDLSAVDAAVISADARGLEVMLTIYKAPPWAEGPNRPPVSIEAAPEGTWKPSPSAFADFGTALARRYSGTFTPPGATSPLPRVRYYEAWNEENLWAFLSPQYEGNKEVAVELYRSLLNAFYDAVKAVDKNNQVVLGGNGPYGDPPGGLRTRPLAFLRQLFCLTDRREPTSCPKPAKFDILGAHPINLSGGPGRSAIDPDDVSSADLPQVAKVLRSAEAAKTLATSGRHPLWVTEFWWQSFPDGGFPAIPGLAKHGRWIEQALYLFWDAGATVAINYHVIDDVYDPSSEGSLQTGAFLSDLTPKPAATAFRFPFVLDRRSKSEALVWGKSPLKGKLTIEKQRSGSWRKVDALKVKRNKVFTTTLNARGKGKYRAVIGDETSLVWTLRK